MPGKRMFLKKPIVTVVAINQMCTLPSVEHEPTALARILHLLFRSAL
jgi:hypothetical protein